MAKKISSYKKLSIVMLQKGWLYKDYKSIAGRKRNLQKLFDLFLVFAKRILLLFEYPLKKLSLINKKVATQQPFIVNNILHQGIHL